MPVNEKIKMLVALTVARNVANVRITDRIGDSDKGMDSQSIHKQVDVALAAGINEASVYINSRGGNVFEATEIANELSRFKTITVRVGALAASAATYLTSKFKTIARPNSQFMFHRPRISTGGDLPSIEADMQLLKNCTADYISAYVAKTGKSADEIEAMLNKGDVWMTAQEALAGGFIDAIEADKEMSLSAQDVVMLEACGAPHIPDLQTQNKNSDKMERLEIIAALGLAADATDEQIQTALKDAKTKATLYAAMQEKEDSAKKQKARVLALKGVQDKKIAATEVDVYAELAENNYEATEKALNAMTPIPQLSAELRGTAKGEPDAHKDWTMQDYLDKDPEALEKLYDENPEAVKRLEASYFGKKK